MFYLEESCLTYALKKEYCFISAYPGFILFGKVLSTYYDEFLQFNHFELSYLYEVIISIVTFLATNEILEEKNIILKKDKNGQSVTYFWKGITLTDEEQNSKKHIIFGSENNCGDCTFQIILNLEEFNFLLFCLSDIFISCLCLKPIEKYFFKRALNESTETIISFQDQPKILGFINNGLENYCALTINKENLIDVLTHYNGYILMLQKIKSLYISDLEPQNNIEFVINLN